MMTCPNCKKPVSGRVCGYCGTSLVENYFRGNAKASAQYPSVRGGNLAAAVVGIFGGLALLGAAVMQALDVFPPGGVPAAMPGAAWWVRILVTVFCGMLFFIQQLILRGMRFSMTFDGCWLFVFVASFGTYLLLYIDRGVSAFYDSQFVPVLLLAGCTLCIASCITSIVAFRKPG